METKCSPLVFEISTVKEYTAPFFPEGSSVKRFSVFESVLISEMILSKVSFFTTIVTIFTGFSGDTTEIFRSPTVTKKDSLVLLASAEEPTRVCNANKENKTANFLK